MISATLDGVELDPKSFTDSRLPFSVTPGEHVAERVEAVFRYSRSGDGLHRFVDPADDRIYLYSQFEVADARRVYACFEQPDLKARFSISVLAPIGWTVVSNGACLSSEPVEQVHATTVTRHVFAETLPISTYLTAVVAGEYHVEQRSHDAAAGSIPMSILCRQSLAPHLDGDGIHEITTRAGFDVFEKHFGYPYPFEQVRPGVRSRVQQRRHGERRLRRDPRRIRLPQPADRGKLIRCERTRSCTSSRICGSGTWSR